MAIFIEIPLNTDHTDLEIISLDSIAKIVSKTESSVMFTLKDSSELEVFHTYPNIKRLIGAQSIIFDINEVPL